MGVPDLPIEDIPIEDLREHPDNPRFITDESLERLVRSIEAEPGMLRARPVVALPDGRIVAGNKRWLAVKEIGWPTIPGVYVEMDDERAKLWMLRDNNEYGEWESKELAEMLAALAAADADLELTGFKAEELDDLLKILDNPDPGDGAGDALATLEVSLGPPEHEVSKGDVWMVGEHHLACVSVYDGWPTFTPLLGDGALLVPYPTPILPLTKRARENRLVMVQPDAWLAGHLLDKYADAHGGEKVYKL